MFFFISLYMQQVLGYDALKAGVAYLPLAVGIIISAGVASQLVTTRRLQAGAGGRVPARRRRAVLVRAGLADGTYVGDVLFPSLLAAVGLGLAFVPLTIAAVPGVAARGGRAGVRADQHLPAGRRRARPGHPGRRSRTRARGRDDRRRRRQGALPAALTEGFQAAFTVGAGFAILGAILTAGPDLEPRPAASTPRRRGAARSRRCRSRRRRATRRTL